MYHNPPRSPPVGAPPLTATKIRRRRSWLLSSFDFADHHYSIKARASNTSLWSGPRL